MRKQCYYKELKLTKKQERQEQSTITKQIRLIIHFQMKKSSTSSRLRQACSILEGPPPHVRLDKRPAEYIILFRGLGGLALAPVRIHLVR